VRPSNREKKRWTQPSEAGKVGHSPYGIAHNGTNGLCVFNGIAHSGTNSLCVFNGIAHNGTNGLCVFNGIAHNGTNSLCALVTALKKWQQSILH
jgi:hypothetical protein